MAKKAAVGIGIGIAVVIAAFYFFSSKSGETIPVVGSGDEQRTIDATVGGEDLGVQQTLRPQWRHEYDRDFEKNTFTLRIAKVAYSSNEYPIDDIGAIANAYKPVTFSASVHVYNNPVAEYVTYSQWRNVTGSDWTAVTFKDIQDSHPVFVTVYENNKPVFNLQASGRGTG